MELEQHYQEVIGIVRKCRREYYLHLWERDDWDQEGRLCLYQLLSAHPELIEEKNKLYVYFKTKFRNRILDYIRKQESQKRRLDKEPYEEVGEISHRLGSGGLQLDDSYALQELLMRYHSQVNQEKQEQLARLLGDERFKGRRALLVELRDYLRDFSPYH